MGLLLCLLIVLPAAVAAVLLAFRTEGARRVLVPISAAIIAACSIAVAAIFFTGGEHSLSFEFEGRTFDIILALVDAVIAASIFVIAFRAHRHAISLLALVQLGLLCVYELVVAPGVQVEIPISIDALSVLMALIIGIIGSGIIVYAIGYMEDFQKGLPADAPDNRPRFFAVMYVFLTGMYLIVFSNNLSWLFCGWEITTFCSFLLIGYTKTAEATRNAFRQIWMNLLGGIAFAVANIIAGTYGVGELTSLIDWGSLVPTRPVDFVVTLLGFAAITKAAQMPFHTWLLGAMVAPTPTSALLHSSTMVKAGCYLLIKLAPCYGFNVGGIMLMLVGGFTFMMASIMAITQSNAKRVLAYSTVANLGLIVACAGIDSPLAVWAAIFLLLFHAAAKSLLFLCVGTAEHHIGSRNIEDMDELFSRMPHLSRFMCTGIIVMFIAPFGMLISKWAAFQSFIDSGNLPLVLMLAFGSAATFFFWAKWLGKITASATTGLPAEKGIHASEWVSISLMAVLALGLTFTFPLVSSLVVEPYLLTSTGIGTDNLWLLSILAVLVIAVLLGAEERRISKERRPVEERRSKRKRLPVYLSGVTFDSDERCFTDSFLNPLAATQRNWYMQDLFPEQRLQDIGELIGSGILLWSVVTSLSAALGIGGGML